MFATSVVMSMILKSVIPQTVSPQELPSSSCPMTGAAPIAESAKMILLPKSNLKAK